MGLNTQDLPDREKADTSNQGGGRRSYGTIPRFIQNKQREYQDRAESAPDRFIRYEYPKLLDESRAAVAKLLRVPTDTVVFVGNATVGVNTVLRNLVWSPDGRDEIVHFNTIYGGCDRTIDYVVETSAGLVSSRCIPLSYPCDDTAILSAFESAVADSLAANKRPRVCLFDVVSSQPGVRFPFEAVTAACREKGILSLIDGAQGIGMVDIDLSAINPDFFVSNCHKWLHTPRGCAVFYVPVRNQHLIRSSVPTSYRFVPQSSLSQDDQASTSRLNPNPTFAAQFEFVGTLDNAPYLCVKDSIKWREEVLGGEEHILTSLTQLAREGGKKAAAILGTKILDNEVQSMTRCSMVNVALPLAVEGADGAELADLPKIPQDEVQDVSNWILRTLVDEYKTFVALYIYGGRWWMRLSAQVYLEVDDFEFAGRTLKEVCERVAKGEYKSA